ncbi:hypothetical protein [Sphingobium sp. LB126]|nr:hypothetical protein [Sphingobium sp. LB126]
MEAGVVSAPSSRADPLIDLCWGSPTSSTRRKDAKRIIDIVLACL